MSELCNIRKEAAVKAPVVKIPTENLVLFFNEAALRMLHDYMGYLPKVESSKVMGPCCLVAGCFARLARLDTFIATKVSFLRDDGSDTAGGHRQNLFHDTFVSFLPIAYEQIVGSKKNICSRLLL